MNPSEDYYTAVRDCDLCGAHMEGGADACLGYIPGVAQACCGHGDEEKAFVELFMTDEDVQLGTVRAYQKKDGRPIIRGAEALAYFKEVGVGPPSQ